MSKKAKKQYSPAELKAYANRLETVHAGLVAIQNEAQRALEENTEIDHAMVGGVVSKLLENTEEGVDTINRGLNAMRHKIDAIKEEENLIVQYRRMVEKQFDIVKKTVTQAVDRIFDEKEDVPHRLEGNLFSIWTQPNGKKSLVIKDPEKIPYEFHRYEVSLKVQANEKGRRFFDALQTFLGSIPQEEVKISVKKGEPEIYSPWITKAIESGEEVPGAEIKEGRHLRMTSSNKIEATLKQIEAAEDTVVDVESQEAA